MTALVVLPGLDGTAELLADFFACVRPHFSDVRAIDYPRTQSLDYDALVRHVRAALPNDAPFVLLAESFSGPVAMRIAADPPRALAGLVLSTTFSRHPAPLLRAFAPFTALLPVHAAPTPALSWWLLGRWATPRMMTALTRALASVSPDVLRARVATALRADVTGDATRITLPVLCLRATQDRLLAASAGVQLARALPHASWVTIEGAHLLLQTSPEASANAVAAFATRLRPLTADGV